jgi:CzcA family heavy metal efflux pump
MLEQLIRLSLNYRTMVLVLAGAVIWFGLRSAMELPVDVLPDITRPRVSIITECPGMPPEEVETLVTLPLEIALNGASGVENLRSNSDAGLSVIQVEFGWNQDVYVARQIIQERLASVSGRLPPGIQPSLAPNSSLLGQIMIVGLWSKSGSTSLDQLRSVADWSVRNRLMQVRGVAQVLVAGPGREQFQVLVEPHRAHEYGVSLADIEEALGQSNRNVSGGFVESRGLAMPVRGIGRITDENDIRKIVVKRQGARPVLIEDIARVVRAPGIAVGDARVNGRPAAVLTIQKQANADTRDLTADLRTALDALRPSLPADVAMAVTYEQRAFIDYSVGNVVTAIRDGSLLVVVVLLVFMYSLRPTMITLTAIPLSLFVSFLVFRWFGFSINVMTLGGIAVALGELVDDAIVDVENIVRRLRDNSRLPADQQRSPINVIFRASSEVRGAIINSTIVVILVFFPLFALSGIEGRLFTPLGVAYIVSILASTVVSLTVTPALSWYLLGRTRTADNYKDPFALALSKRIAKPMIDLSLSRSGFAISLGTLFVMVSISGILLWRMGKDFLPSFDEGASQVNLFLPPGASLSSSVATAAIAEERLGSLLATNEKPDGPLLWITSKSGRAEDDEHVMGSNVTEMVLTLNPAVRHTRDELVALLEKTVGEIPGAVVEIEQPIAHMIGHMLSGVSAEIGIKIFGDDLGVLQASAAKIRDILSNVDGLTTPIVEQQQMVPQLRVELRRESLARYGFTSDYVNRMLETALRGQIVDRVLVGQRSVELMMRVDMPRTGDINELLRMPVESLDGKRVPLSEIAGVYESWGPNTVKRENSRRRIIVRANTSDRDLVSAVDEIGRRLKSELVLPEGYFYELGGEFEAQQSATRRILLLGGVALAGIVVVLFSVLRSVRLVVQVLIALPAGFIGGVIALMLTGLTLSIAATIGFVSLGGIAIRNGILLIESWQARTEGLDPSDQPARRRAIVAGSLERLAPVMMTTLTTGLALVPLVAGGHEPGREILFPVATVILGGLISSALAEYLVRPGLYWFWGGRKSARGDSGRVSE